MVIITVSQRPVASISPESVRLTALWAEINQIVHRALQGGKQEAPVALHEIVQRFSVWQVGEITNGDMFHVSVDLMIPMPKHHTKKSLCGAIAALVREILGGSVSGVVIVRVIPAAVERV